MVLDSAGLCGCFNSEKLKASTSIRTYFYIYEITHLVFGIAVNAVLLYFSCKIHVLIKENADADITRNVARSGLRCHVHVL